ncbi:MAG: efflux RND transporter periplasmic adaptor subunit, partial [Verrucomicrobiales bacterium]
TMRVEVDLPNPEGAILPGLYGRLNILLETRSQALVLPPDSIRASDEGAFVFVVRDDGTASKRPVRTGIDNGRVIEILEGLEGSERVVGGMIGRLKEAQAVTVISK